MHCLHWKLTHTGWPSPSNLGDTGVHTCDLTRTPSLQHSQPPLALVTVSQSMTHPNQLPCMFSCHQDTPTTTPFLTLPAHDGPRIKPLQHTFPSPRTLSKLSSVPRPNWGHPPGSRRDSRLTTCRWQPRASAAAARHTARRRPTRPRPQERPSHPAPSPALPRPSAAASA